jgi:hypothetical protein
MKECVSLKVAQKLKEAGYNSKHCGYAYDFMGWEVGWKLNVVDPKVMRNYIEMVSAPTGLQLASELPVNLANFGTHLKIEKIKTGWAVYYYAEVVKAKTLPDALGLMMVFLLETKLI